MDVGKFLRLQGAIDAAIESSKEKNSTQAGPAIQDAYHRLLQEIRESKPNEDQEEFDRLFPDTVVPSRKARQTDPVSALEKYGTAQTLLSSLSGWLGGYVRLRLRWRLGRRPEVHRQGHGDGV
jgi:hypothetical protein